MKVATIVSQCEQEFISRAIAVGKRIDGRHIHDYRTINIEFGNELGLCQVTLGRTRVLVQVSSEVVLPNASRPSDGILFLNVDLSPMASPDFESGRITEYGVEIRRLLERCIIDSRALDVEALCIVAGEKVWAIRVDAHVLNHDGNIIDCLSIATIAALVHFRRPDVTISGEEVTIHTMEEKHPVPLSIHHWPISVTFAFFNKGDHLVMDPSEREEKIMDGKTVLVMNIYREICTLHVGGTISLHKEQILRCAHLATSKVMEITELIKASLKTDAERRSQGDTPGLTVSIHKNFITTAAQDKIKLDITKTKGSATELVRDGIKKAVDSLTKEMGNVPVKVKGPGTAQIGEGGETTLIVSDDDYDDDDEEDIKLISMMRAAATTVSSAPTTTVEKAPEIDTVDLSGESEEEVVTLNANVISEERRNWYSDTW